MENADKTNKELKKKFEKLRQVQWMFEKKPEDVSKKEIDIYDTGYGDLTELNKDGLILQNLGRELLKQITSEHLNLLETSSAAYEANGDYAYSIFRSGWCRLLDKASRDLCRTKDNKKALKSGKWLCHESCWSDCSKKAIEEKNPFDIECNGGIRLYAIPIFAENKVIGAINFGYGDPPKDMRTLKEIAKRYNLDHNLLHKEAAAYQSRPQFLIEVAKERLKTTATIIGSLVENKLIQKREQHFKRVLQGIRNVNKLITQEKDPIELADKACQNLANTMGYNLAWIALFDEKSKVYYTTFSGIGEGQFQPISQNIKKGIYPGCMVSALKQNKLIASTHNKGDCSGCNLSTISEGQAALTAKISHKGKTYGVLTVSTPLEYVDSQEELEHFNETANDLGFAFYKIKLEEEHKQNEKKIRWWKELLEHIVHNDISAIAIHDKNLNYLWVSQRYLKDYRVKNKDIIGKHHYEVFPDIPEKWRKIHQRVLNGEVLNAEEDVFPCADGTIEYTKWECRPWYEANGEIGGIVLYTEVITKRIKTEKDLKERIKELNCLYKIAKISNNPQIKTENFFNKVINIIPESFQHPEKTSARLSLDNKTYETDNFIKTNKKITNDIVLKNSKAGSLEVYYVENENKPDESFLAEEKKMIKSIATEISKFIERKHTEEALKETNKNLEEMIYVASHDLQVPLVSMDGYASELLENYIGRLDEEGEYCIKRLQSNAQRMHKLILGLLDISRLTTDQMQFEQFNLNSVLKTIIEDLSLVIEKANAHITVGKLPDLYADEKRIESVLRNIVINAINYNGKKIEIQFKNNVLSVKDDGIGIPPGQLERIFNPGERIKALKIEGIGMGLSYCKKVINHHKGKIWAESKGKNKGTTIKIKFNKENLISGKNIFKSM